LYAGVKTKPRGGSSRRTIGVAAEVVLKQFPSYFPSDWSGLTARRVLAVVLLPLALTVFCLQASAAERAPERTVETAQLVEKDDLFYLSGETAPFTGLAREFDENGKIRVERRLAAGKTVAFKQWYKNGGPSSETVISPAGLTRKLWFENGKPEEDTEVVIDRGVKVSEKSKLYYESGGLRLEIGYAREKLQGALKEYAPDGALLREETYDQGKMTRKAK
jgi:antitoxin component YwqK of YwqJK toxin-antitoxin module